MMMMFVCLALPPLQDVSPQDLKAFPLHEIAKKAAHNAEEQYIYCQQQRILNMYPNLPWPQWEHQARYCWECWRLLETAHLFSSTDKPGITLGVTADSLKKLRIKLGTDHYYNGSMPTPVYTHYLYPDGVINWNDGPENEEELP